MKKSKFIIVIWLLSIITFLDANEQKKLAYIVSDTSIPFWDILSRGIKNKTDILGYQLKIYDSHNNSKKELISTIKAIKDKVSGIIVSPTSSSSCVTILKLAKTASIPVVIADIGTDSGEYVSYISSDNKNGAYNIGKILAEKMISLGLQKGKVGIIAIPQKRINGQLRTAGFMKALDEYNIKSVEIQQQVSFSYAETFNFTRDMIREHNDLKAIWLQGSDKYKGALDAIEYSRKKDEILLITFDAEPIFLDLIPKGILVGSAMQQPYLMGQKSVEVMNKYLKGEKVKKNIQLPVLAISTDNIDAKLPIIERNVLGIKTK